MFKISRVDPIDENRLWKGQILAKGCWYGYWNGIPIISDQYLIGNLVHVIRRTREFTWEDRWIHIERPDLPIEFAQCMWAKRHVYLERIGVVEH